MPLLILLGSIVSSVLCVSIVGGTVIILATSTQPVYLIAFTSLCCGWAALLFFEIALGLWVDFNHEQQTY